MTKVLLDTDIGTDVDDAVALAYLLSHPDCELLGITTVTGEATKRASLASVICKAAGKEIPIYPGAEHPMQGEQRQPVAQQAAALPNWPHETQFPLNQAVDFLANTIRTYPGEVILLTIGPLTNAGLLFNTYPDVADLLKGLVMMGGNFGDDTESGRVEWNIAGDPLASQITYKAPVRTAPFAGTECDPAGDDVSGGGSQTLHCAHPAPGHGHGGDLVWPVLSIHHVSRSPGRGDDLCTGVMFLPAGNRLAWRMKTSPEAQSGSRAAAASLMRLP